jgi:hypothetical protein
MSESKVNKRSIASFNADESYDRYKRLRWQPVLLLTAAVASILAWKLNVYRPDILLMSMLPSSMLSFDQRTHKIMSLTPLIGQAISKSVLI